MLIKFREIDIVCVFRGVFEVFDDGKCLIIFILYYKVFRLLDIIVNVWGLNINYISLEVFLKI